MASEQPWERGRGQWALRIWVDTLVPVQRAKRLVQTELVDPWVEVHRAGRRTVTGRAGSRRWKLTETMNTEREQLVHTHTLDRHWITHIIEHTSCMLTGGQENTHTHTHTHTHTQTQQAKGGRKRSTGNKITQSGANWEVYIRDNQEVMMVARLWAGVTVQLSSVLIKISNVHSFLSSGAGFCRWTQLRRVHEAKASYIQHQHQQASYRSRHSGAL